MLKEGGNTKSVVAGKSTQVGIGPDIDELFGEDSDREVKLDQLDKSKTSGRSSIMRKNNLSEIKK